MAAIHLEDCPGVFSRLPCTSILGWPVLWRLIFCLLLPTVVSAQEVYLPDVTTVIAGEELEVAEEALLEYSASLPQRPPVSPEPPQPVPEPAAPVQEPLPPSVVELASSLPQQQFFVEGLIAPAWPLGLLSQFQVYTEGEAPFRLDFGYGVVGGYGLETTEDGFFHTKSLLSVEKTFLLKKTSLQSPGNGIGTQKPSPAQLKVAGGYLSLDNGLQGHSLLFDDINRRGASLQMAMEIPLPHGFSFGAELPLGWYNRYAGFSSTVGRTKVNRGVALSILQLTPRLKATWSTAAHQPFPSSHLFDLGLVLGWGYTASLDPEVVLSQNRMHLEASATWRWNDALKVQGNLSLVSFPSGSGADDVRLLLPFSLGVEWGRILKQGDLQLFARGGLESRPVNFLELEEREAFVNLLAKSLIKEGEQSDWFFTAGARLPLASHLGLDLAANFKQSALGNNVLTGNYAAGINGYTGLFAGDFVARTAFATQGAVTMELNSFLMKAGWRGNWFYVPPSLPPHCIFLSLGYNASSKGWNGAFRWGGELRTNFGIHGPDNVPELGVMAYFKLVENLRLELEVRDMIKLFSGRQRVLVAPYVKDSGSVSLSLQFSF